MPNERRAFMKFGLAALAAGYGIRKSFEIDPGPFNERVSRTLWNAQGLAKTYSREQAGELRVNSLVGLESELEEFKLRIESPNASPRELTLEDVQRLPITEQTTQFTCIEGWSAIAHWKGALLKHLAPASPPAYVSLSTPDNEYYVGLDIESALHPQTLLAWELNGQPLTPDHGAPIRLVIPVKYGIKNIKRVGTIRFTPHRPDDYWHERGYDWYAGL
jgi:DMSO/TMAO reductase YedYZ molybdopterin-dependent catalytic subunit